MPYDLIGLFFSELFSRLIHLDHNSGLNILAAVSNAQIISFFVPKKTDLRINPQHNYYSFEHMPNLM